MTKIWPGGDNLADVFDASSDPNPGKPIEDKYGLVSWGTGMVAITPLFTSLDKSGWELLAFIDNEEYQRVWEAAKQRNTLRRRRERTPDDFGLLLHDNNPLTLAEEEVALERCGLTLDEAKELVAAKKKATTPKKTQEERGQ